MNKLLVLFFILISLSTAWADDELEEPAPMACDPDKIFKLLVKKGLLDMGESKICADMTQFPAISLNLKEANYDLNGMPIEGGNTKQEQKVAELHKFFNSVLGEGEKLGINTRGYADGTFRKSEDDDVRIQNEIFENGKISYSKLEKVIKPMDESGYKGIVETLKKIPQQPPTFEQIKSNRKAISMIRNSYLAKRRGENICNILFQDPSKCDNQGEISTQLDQGKTCFDGCCDGRRGAQVKFTLPSQLIKSEVSKATWQPGFTLAKGDFAKRLQFGATFSVLDLPLSEDDEDLKKYEKAIEKHEEITDSMIEKDRERFRKAMKNNGCESNDMIVDSVRKIWWKLRRLGPYFSDDVRKAFAEKDFEKAYSLMNASKMDDLEKASFRMMISGGLKDVRAVGDSQCASLQMVNTAYSDMSSKDYKECKINKDESTHTDLQKYDNVADLVKASEKNGEVIITSGEDESPGVFWMFDPKTGQKKMFTYGKDCKKAPSGVAYNYIISKSKKVVDNWGKYSPTGKNHYNNNCFQIKAQNPYNDLDSFSHFPKALNSDGGGGMPTDHMSCLSVGKVYSNELKNNPDSLKSLGKPYCKVAKNNELTLEFDYRKVDPVKGQHGFICGACTSGLKYNTREKKFKYDPRVEIKSGSVNYSKLAWEQTLNNQNTNLTFGSTKHLRTYLIPNCGSSCENACDCLKGGNIEQLTKDAEMVDMTDLSTSTEFKLQKYKGDGSGSFACFFTPQVPNTCGVDPNGHSHPEDKSATTVTEKCKLEEALKLLPDKASEPTTDEVNIYYKACKSDPFPMPEAECAYADNNICSGIQKANNCTVPTKKVKSSSGGGKGDGE